MRAEFFYNLGQDYPYDANDNNQAREPVDWAVKAARGVISNLTDRKNIKWGFDRVDLDVREELIDTVAEIIRIASQQNR